MVQAHVLRGGLNVTGPPENIDVAFASRRWGSAARIGSASGESQTVCTRRRIQLANRLSHRSTLTLRVWCRKQPAAAVLSVRIEPGCGLVRCPRRRPTYFSSHGADVGKSLGRWLQHGVPAFQCIR